MNFYDSIYIIPLMTVAFAVFNPLGAWLTKQIHPRFVILIGLTIAVSAIYVTSLVHTFSQFILTFTIYMCGVGICYFPPLICGWEWLSD